MTEKGWYKDPSSRHELRFFNGETWTTAVMDHGVQSTDDPRSPAPTPADLNAPPPTSAPVPTAPVPTTRPASNGLALAALIVGIGGVLFGIIPLFFFFAFILGALALVFGFVGRGRARTSGAGKGQATAGIILGAIAVALGVIGVVIVSDAFDDVDEAFDEANESLEESTGEASEDDYDLATGECTFDADFGQAELSGTITNTSEEERSYEIAVEFTDFDGTRIERTSTFAQDIAPGQTAEWSTSTFDADAQPGCDVVGVKNSF